ncbi:MAG: Crp/Fnr family transcriptional regulator [Rhodoferax sp.]
MRVDHFDMPRHLRTLPMFRGLSEPERQNVARGCRLRRFSRGDMVFRAGEMCESFHFVVSGQVRLYVASSTGVEKVIELIGPGHSFAEAMMFLPKPYMLNAQTLTDTLIMTVSKQAVFNEIERDPRFSMHMLSGISHWLHRLLLDVEGYALHSGMQRLIGYLLRDVELESDEDFGVVTVSFPVSKATIASRLSLTPEYFSRVLHQLESENLIEIDKREVRILDVRRLASYGSH